MTGQQVHKNDQHGGGLSLFKDVLFFILRTGGCERSKKKNYSHRSHVTLKKGGGGGTTCPFIVPGYILEKKEGLILFFGEHRQGASLKTD